MSINQNSPSAYGTRPGGLFTIGTKPIVSNRNPTGADKAPIGQLWVNQVTSSAYILTGSIAGVAQWGDITGGGGVFLTLQVNPGGLSVGNIPAGAPGTITTTEGITSNAGGITALTGNIDAITGNIVASNGSLFANNINANAGGPSIVQQKSRGAAFQIVHANDVLGTEYFSGADGTQFVVGAGISATVVGAPGVNRVGASLNFYTHPDAATGILPTLRMYIESTGVLTISAPDAPAANALVLLGAGGILLGTGNISTVGGSITAGLAVVGGTLYSAGDLGGVLASTSITNVTDTAQSTGLLTILSDSVNPGTNAGFIKVYIGTAVAYVPYFTNIAP